MPDTFEATVSVITRKKSKRGLRSCRQPSRCPVACSKFARASRKSRREARRAPKIRQTRWDVRHAKPDRWDEFVRRAQKYVDTGNLDSEEIEYKVDIGRKLNLAREAVLGSKDGWTNLVKTGINCNLIFRIDLSKFRDWVDESPDLALAALRELWTDNNASVADRIRAFSSRSSRLGDRRDGNAYYCCLSFAHGSGCPAVCAVQSDGVR